MRRERRAANVQKMKRDFHNIEVQIDELVLHGFSFTDRYVIGDAFSLEIERMLNASTSHAFIHQDTNLSTINAGKIMLQANARPTSTGMQVARAVYGSLNNIRERGRS